MIEVIHTPPECWPKLADAFGLKWEGNVVLTYGAQIYSPLKEIQPRTLVHELVHVEQQKGQNMEDWLELYLTSSDFVRDVEGPAFAAEAAFLEATITNEAELWCKKYRLAKTMARMYRNAFTLESASGIINLQKHG